MSEYKCERCGHTSNDLSNMRRHWKKKTPCEAILSDISVSTLLSNSLTRKPNDQYKCKECGKLLSSRSGLYLHEKNKVCIKKKDKEELQQKVVTLEKKIAELSTNNNVTIVNNNSVTNNIQNNIQNIQNNQHNTINIKDFGFEDIRHLESDKEYMTKCFMEKDITGLIKSIHCDNKHPENQNVRMKSLKHEFMETYVDGQWIVTDQEETFDELLNKGYRVLNFFSYRNKQHIIDECEDGEDEYDDLRGWLEELYHDKKVRKPLKRKLLILFFNNKTLLMEKKIGKDDDSDAENSGSEELPEEEASKYKISRFDAEAWKARRQAKVYQETKQD